ncbi:hypothetical protein VK91_00970 [Lysinibacillus sp. LK3]|nr:hypothetical protein VK91_00970 [Lysinibacillus sp. LK3]
MVTNLWCVTLKIFNDSSQIMANLFACKMNNSIKKNKQFRFRSDHSEQGDEQFEVKESASNQEKSGFA